MNNIFKMMQIDLNRIKKIINKAKFNNKMILNINNIISNNYYLKMKRCNKNKEKFIILMQQKSKNNNINCRVNQRMLLRIRNINLKNNNNNKVKYHRNRNKIKFTVHKIKKMLDIVLKFKIKIK